MKSTFESRLVEECSPTLAGVKPGSLFPYTSENHENVSDILDYWNRKLSGKGICMCKLRASNNRYLIFVYRPKAIEQILKDKNTFLFLGKYGYSMCGRLEEYIEFLIRRMSNTKSFPHEIGLFLGYPLHDVIAYINNEGKNSCCCGCWKVYGDKSEAQRCFQRFNKCTSIYKRLFNSGKTVLQLAVAA